MGVYLQGADLTTFGVPNASAAQIQEASLLIDSFLNRPEGLIHDTAVMDNTQQPITAVIRLGPRSYHQIILDRKPVASVLTVVFSTTGNNWVPVQSFEYVQDYGLVMPYTYANQLIQVTFLAGWVYTELPFAIKQACANIVGVMTSSDELVGNILSFKMGDGQVTRKSTSHLSEDTVALLRPWKRVYSL